jgi:hypothetical protein
MQKRGRRSLLLESSGDTRVAERCRQRTVWGHNADESHPESARQDAKAAG